MKQRVMLIIAAVLFMLASGTPDSHAGPPDETPALRLTIAFTGDVSGYLEPCG